MYTTSSVFLKTLSEAGVTHAFVNWGSDHPGFLEDLERQRLESPNKSGETKPTIVTCPNEMVALSCAQGYAQVTGKPAACIVHVDVGTLAMAGAIHNVDRSRTPVLIYAGASPFSDEKEHKGGRNEWIMGIQDIPDQTAIVRQYMRATSQINSSKTVAKTVKRALQIAMSQPTGPVYLWGRREVMEEEVDVSALRNLGKDLQQWPSLSKTALSPDAITHITTALLAAQSPLIITSHLGRNQEAVALLLALSTTLAIPIIEAAPSCVNVPFSHPYYLGCTYLQPGSHTPLLRQADVILVLDSYVPWIQANDKPGPDARIFVVDSGDPLSKTFGVWHIDAEMVCLADCEVALEGLMYEVRDVKNRDFLGSKAIVDLIVDRGRRAEEMHREMVGRVDEAERVEEGSLKEDTPLRSPVVLGALRRVIDSQTPSQGKDVLVLNEGISNYPVTWAHMKRDTPGSMFTSGGSSLGWGIGAVVGAHIGTSQLKLAEDGREYDLVVSVVGDGSFLFGVPSSVYWMARKYDTPFLTIILNNGGWKSPKLSMLGVYPQGVGSSQAGARLSVGFGPDCPDYSQIAVAASAGWAWGKRVVGAGSLKELEDVLAEAVRQVVVERRCAVVDVVLESI